MARKVIVNLFVAFILFPFMFSFKYWGNIIKGVYKYYDAYYESLSEYIQVLLHQQVYPYLSFVFLIFMLTPFQLIKDYRYSKNKKGIVLWKKCLTLSGLIAFWFAVIFRPPITNMGDRAILFGSLLAIGSITALILYLLVDRYVERPRVDQKPDGQPKEM